MKTFVFFKHHAVRLEEPQFDLESLPTQEAAIEHARHLLAKDGYATVEVWDGLNPAVEVKPNGKQD